MSISRSEIEPKNPGRIIVKRFTIFFLALSLLALFFWTVGNARGFLDSTQLLFISALRFSSLALALSSAVGLAVTLVFGKEQKRLAVRIGPIALALAGYLILIATGLLLGLLSDALMFLSQGLK